MGNKGEFPKKERDDEKLISFLEIFHGK